MKTSPKRRGAAVELAIARLLGGERYAGSTSNPGRSGADLNIPHTLLYADVKARSRLSMPMSYIAAFDVYERQFEQVGKPGMPYALWYMAIGAMAIRLDQVEAVLAGAGWIAGATSEPVSKAPLKWIDNMASTCPEGVYPAAILHLKGRQYERALVMMRDDVMARWLKHFTRVGVLREH